MTLFLSLVLCSLDSSLLHQPVAASYASSLVLAKDVLFTYKCPEVIFEIKNIIIDCTKEIARLNRRERKEFFLNKIKSFKLVVTITGRSIILG